MTDGWTEDRLAEVTALWNYGEMSATQIAAKVGGGMTRMAIIGKMNRLKVASAKPKANKGKKIAYPANRKKAYVDPVAAARRADRARQIAEAREREHAAQVAKDAGPSIPLPDSKLVHLIDLTAETCHWPLGDPRHDDFRFCGADIAFGKTYCPGHRVLSYIPGKMPQAKLWKP